MTSIILPPSAASVFADLNRRVSSLSQFGCGPNHQPKRGAQPTRTIANLRLMTNRRTMIQRQSGSVSFTQCHYRKETRWIESGVRHSVRACCCSVMTHPINCVHLLSSKDCDMFVCIRSVSHLMPHSCLLPYADLPAFS